MIFLWLSYDFFMVFSSLWLSYGYFMIYLILWLSYGYLMIFFSSYAYLIAMIFSVLSVEILTFIT